MAATEFVPKQHETEAITAHVIWMTTGLSPARATRVAMTSATNPSLEDIITGAIPGMPRVVVHNPVLAFEVGRGVHAGLVRRRGRQARPVRAGPRGLAPATRRSTATATGPAIGVNPDDRPADHDQRVDRPARAEGGGGRRGRDLRHLRRHPGDEEQPDRRDGPARLPGLELEVQGRPPDRQHPGLPGAARQHDRDADVPRASRSPAWRRCPSSTTQLRPKWLFERTAHESCNRAGFYEQGNFATEYGADHRCLVKLGCKGPVVKCNVPLRGWVNGIGGCPNVGGICMACTMPGFPDKYMPFMDADPRGDVAAELQRSSPTGRSCAGAATGTSSTSTTRSRSGGTTGPSSPPATQKRW